MESKPELKREAVFENTILLEQANLVYSLAMKTYADGDMSAYDKLMGVANILYMMECGTYVVHVHTDFDNLGVY
jgi:hypothetical protein